MERKDKKSITLYDFLTDDEIKQAQQLKTAKDICRVIIKPNIGRINKDLGQENDEMYLAYMVEYVVSIVNSSK
jgi:hypothetical protein